MRRLRPDLRAFTVDALHLVGLSGFAIAQPLFDILGRSPGLFLDRGASPPGVVLFALLLVFVPPAVLVALELAALASGGAPLRRAVHLVFMGALGALFLVPIIDRVDALPDAAVLVAVLAGAALFTWAYHRLHHVRRFFTLSAIAPAVFFGSFVFATPVSAVLSPAEPEPVASGLVPPSSPPIVLVIFDEFPLSSILDPDLDIDEHRFPNIARLAEGATWFRNATTVSDATVQAIPATLTGRLVWPNSGMSASFHPRNLYTLLGDAYEVRTDPTGLCPSRICESGSPPADPDWTSLPSGRAIAQLLRDATKVLGLLAVPSGWAWRLPAVEQLGLEAFTDAPGPLEPDPRWTLFEERVGEIAPRDGPTLDVVYSFLPHRPWSFLPTGVTYAPLDWRIPGLGTDFTWSADPAPVLSSYHRHLLQVGTVDTLIGTLLEHLEAVGMYDDVLLVVTADHGITFQPGENSRLDPTPETLPELAPVPLFMKLPGQRTAEVSDRNAELIDVLPTIVDLLSVDIGWRFHGASLLSSSERPEKLLIDSKGREHRLPGRYLDALGRAVERKYGFTGLPREPRGPIDAFYRVSEHGSLVGEPVEAFDIGPAAPGSMEIENAEGLRSVDTAEPIVPAILDASTTGRELVGRPVVVTVNGTVGAVPRAFRGHGRTRVISPFPPTLLRDGSNEVALYVLGEGRTLHPIDTAS